MSTITTDAELDALYGEPVKRSLTKELDHLNDHYRAYIAAAPFCVVATVGPEGLDCSPRGDPAPIVHVEDSKTLLLPDRRGNGRIDGLRNLIRDPRISLLFLIPGIDITIRVNGRAVISVDPALLERFAFNGKPPKSVIVATVERAYYQCPKALVRSRLWLADAHVAKDSLPTGGDMQSWFADQIGETFDGAEYDATYPAHMAKTIY
jgi:PPOX class probable FMN-dependent enzyme